jgi:hypothetical protein
MPASTGMPVWFSSAWRKKGRSAAAPVGVEFLLLRQFDAAAVDQPHQGNVQPLGEVGNPQDIFALAGDPGAGHGLVVKPDDYRPFACDFSQTVKNVGIALDIVFRVIQGVKRAPGARVDEIPQPLPDRQLATGVDFFFREPGTFDLLNVGRHIFFDLTQLVGVVSGTFYHPFIQGAAKGRHFLKIRSHGNPFRSGLGLIINLIKFIIKCSLMNMPETVNIFLNHLRI